MSAWRSSAVVLALIVAIAAAANFAARMDRSKEPEIAEEAVAIALENYFDFLIEVVPMEVEGVTYTYLALCLTSEQPLDLERLNAAFADGKALAVPLSDCTPDNAEQAALQPALPFYFHPDGQDAAYVAVDAQCPATNRCVVEVDTLPWLFRYVVFRRGSQWELHKFEGLERRNIFHHEPTPESDPLLEGSAK